VFRSARVAVEVRGCFWHACPEHYRLPQTNDSYWSAKAARNVARDRDTAERLTAAGWRLIVVWEHDDVHEAAAHIESAVRERPQSHLPREQWSGGAR